MGRQKDGKENQSWFRDTLKENRFEDQLFEAKSVGVDITTSGVEQEEIGKHIQKGKSYLPQNAVSVTKRILRPWSGTQLMGIQIVRGRRQGQQKQK